MLNNQPISHTINKRTTRRKYVSVILVLCFCFTLPVFAQETTNSTLGGVKDILQSFLSIMSRGRVVLAVLAGKLMTNDRVFGAALHMDIYLRKIWNIMKNFANFALIAFLLGTLIKNLIGKQDLKIKELITKTLIAGVLIQASWFMMGALIDISTVAVSAIGSFPVSFMQGNADFKARMTDEVAKIRQTNWKIDGTATDPQKIITPENAGNDTTENPMSNDEILNSLMPDANSMGGPLVFLGTSVFRFYEYLGQDTQETVESVTVAFSLKTIVLIIFTIALLLLLIANIVRVAFLRIFIIASPFIILFKVFKDDKMPGGGKGFAKYLSMSSLLDLVFKPVIFMAMMSVILIFVVSIQNIMLSQSNFDLNGVSMSVEATKQTATLAVQGVSSITINDNIFSSFGNSSKSIFADLILFFLTIFLMWKLVTRSLTSGEGPIQSVMKPITNFAEGMLKNAPILGGFSVTAIQKSSQETKKQFADSIGMRTSGEFYKGEQELQSKINTLLGLPMPRTEPDYNSLSRIIKSGPDPQGAFFTKSVELGKVKQGGLSLSEPRWRRLLEEWLKRNRTTLKQNGRGTDNDVDNLDEFLGKTNNDIDHQKNRAKLHELMGGRGNAVGQTQTTGKPTYDQLMNMQYFKGESTK